MENIDYCKKFAQVPTSLAELNLRQGDILIFAHIRIHYNHKTGLCNPGISLISKESGYSQKFVCDSIKRLEDAGLFKVERCRGASNKYTFTEKSKKFERFAETFLKLKDLTLHTKEFYMRIQEFLYIHDDGTAETTYDVHQLADLTGLDYRSVKKYLKELEDKKYLNSEKGTTTTEVGVLNTRYVFDLDKLGQQILYKLKEHDDRLNQHENEMSSIRQELFEKNKVVVKLSKQVDYLTRQVRLLNVKEVQFEKANPSEVYPESYEF